MSKEISIKEAVIKTYKVLAVFTSAIICLLCIMFMSLFTLYGFYKNIFVIYFPCIISLSLLIFAHNIIHNELMELLKK